MNYSTNNFPIPQQSFGLDINNNNILSWVNEVEDLFSTQQQSIPVSQDNKDYFEYFQKFPSYDDPYLQSNTNNNHAHGSLSVPLNTSGTHQAIQFKNPFMEPLGPADLDYSRGNNLDFAAEYKKRVLEEPKQPEEKVRKEHHNDVEKKRRKMINSELNTLKAMIPYCKDTTTNKLTVLQLACKYINNLQDTQKKLLEQNQKLKEVNEQLTSEVKECHKILWEKDEIVVTTLVSSPSGVKTT